MIIQPMSLPFLALPHVPVPKFVRRMRKRARSRYPMPVPEAKQTKARLRRLGVSLTGTTHWERVEMLGRILASRHEGNS